MKAMQVNRILNNPADIVKRTHNTRQNAEDKDVQLTLNNAAVRAGQTNTCYNAEDNAIQNTTISIVEENPSSEHKALSNPRGDIRFALDKVSSGDGEICDTKGGLEIGPKDSAL